MQTENALRWRGLLGGIALVVQADRAAVEDAEAAAGASAVGCNPVVTRFGQWSVREVSYA
jgi:hypothetical protein